MFLNQFVDFVTPTLCFSPSAVVLKGIEIKLQGKTNSCLDGVNQKAGHAKEIKYPEL